MTGPPDSRRGPADDEAPASSAAAKPLDSFSILVPPTFVAEVDRAERLAYYEAEQRLTPAVAATDPLPLRVADGKTAERLAHAEEAVRCLLAQGLNGVADWPVEAREAWLMAYSDGDAEQEPDLWHGVEDDVERWTRRLTAYHAVHGFNGGRPLAPCYSLSDLRVDPHGQEPDKRDLRRLPLLLEDLADAHVEHWYYAAPFCSRCYGLLLAEARLRRWLVANPGKTPRESIPAAVPGDEVAPDLSQQQRSPFLDLDALLDMPEAGMLVEGLVPQGAYGLITGRDGTGKSFLAIDLALHVATLTSQWYGERPVDIVNYGRALYLVGEGVQSFGKRVQAWLDEHGVERPHKDDLVFRNGTVDLYGGGAAFDALLAKVQELEPDLIVIDTLARSSGAGEANSATDMSIVRGRIDMLRRASNGGTVLVVAHTTKSDTDARGSSVIEDDADFVLHVELKDDGHTQVVKVAKQKDGPSGHAVTLAVAQVQVDGGTTLVLREPGKGATPLVSPEDSTKNRILGVLLEQRSLDPKTQADLTLTLKETGREVTRQAVGKALGVLVKEGSVLAVKRGGSKRYCIAPHRIPKDMR